MNPSTLAALLVIQPAQPPQPAPPTALEGTPKSGIRRIRPHEEAAHAASLAEGAVEAMRPRSDTSPTVHELDPWSEHDLLPRIETLLMRTGDSQPDLGEVVTAAVNTGKLLREHSVCEPITPEDIVETVPVRKRLSSVPTMARAPSAPTIALAVEPPPPSRPPPLPARAKAPPLPPASGRPAIVTALQPTLLQQRPPHLPGRAAPVGAITAPMAVAKTPPIPPIPQGATRFEVGRALSAHISAHLELGLKAIPFPSQAPPARLEVVAPSTPRVRRAKIVREVPIRPSEPAPLPSVRESSPSASGVARRSGPSGDGAGRAGRAMSRVEDRLEDRTVTTLLVMFVSLAFGASLFFGALVGWLPI